MKILNGQKAFSLSTKGNTENICIKEAVIFCEFQADGFLHIGWVVRNQPGEVLSFKGLQVLKIVSGMYMLIGY